MATTSVPKGFSEPVKKKPKRLIIAVEAVDKEGKTTFGLSAPGPVALMDMDIGTEGVVDNYIGKKKLYIAGFDYRDSTDPAEWLKMWVKYKETFLTALTDKWIRTVVVDTATEAWELARLARFGKLTQVLPHHYGPVNAEFRDLIRKAYDTDKNLILIHKMKEQYINDKGTGKMIRSGFNDTAYLVQVNIRTWYRAKERLFGLTVVNCRQNMSIAGMELTEPINDFAHLAAEVYPQTDAEDWEK